MGGARKPADDEQRGQLFEELLSEVPFVYLRLKAVTRAVQGEGELSGARRGVLRSLAAGPATVPRLAEERPVARQAMQRLVNELVAEGFAEFTRNPGHRRSQLVRLTPAGQDRFAEMQARERQAAAGLMADLGATELRTALAVMKTLSGRLAGMIHEREDK